MSKTITAAALPLLRLTEEDAFALQQLSRQLRREIVSQYETFLFQSNGRVDEERWKHTRSDGDMHAFVECKGELKNDLDMLQSEGSSHALFISPMLISDAEIFPQATLAVETQQRRVLVWGYQAGTLDDVMYGASFRDTTEFQAFWHSQQDITTECAVLAEVEGASDDDPYNFLGVTWVMQTFPLAQSVVKPRDMLTVTNVLVSNLSNGERIGVFVSHSIQHRDLSELREFGVVRATSSVLRVFRQFDSGRVEVYMTHFLDSKGSTSEAFDLKQSVDYMLPSTGCLARAGFCKKLQWMVRGWDSTRTNASADKDTTSSTAGTPKNCELCIRAGGKSVLSSGTPCAVCLKSVCSRCCVAYDLPRQTIVLGDKPTTKATDICVECVLHAKTLPTEEVAHDEYNQRCGLGCTVATK